MSTYPVAYALQSSDRVFPFVFCLHYTLFLTICQQLLRNNSNVFQNFVHSMFKTLNQIFPFAPEIHAVNLTNRLMSFKKFWYHQSRRPGAGRDRETAAAEGRAGRKQRKSAGPEGPQGPEAGAAEEQTAHARGADREQGANAGGGGGGPSSTHPHPHQ
jgi:hypothetical protein